MATKQSPLERLLRINSEPKTSLGKDADGRSLSAKDAETLAAWVRNCYENAKSARAKTQMQWGLNLGMFRGMQYIQYLKSIQNFSTPPAPPWRVRHTTNLIRPMIRIEISKLTSQKPSATAVPATNDDDDLMAAEAAEAVWESLYTRKKIKDVFARNVFWQTTCGTSFIKTWWDNSSTDYDSNQPGDICYGHVTPFHLFVPDLREVTLEGQQWLINVYTLPTESLNQRYGSAIATPLQPSVITQNDIIADAYMDTQTPVGKTADSCLVMEMWAKPGAHSMLPQGGMVTVIDNQVVQFSADGLPYSHGEYPFAKFDHIPSGKFYADSSIVDVIGIQREYNRTLSQVIEAKNRIAKPKMAVQKGAIDVAKVNTEAGQFIEYKFGFQPPTPIQMPEIPAYVFNHAQMMRSDFEDITGQHQVSRGSTPSGVTAATAINYLQEADDGYLTHTFQSIESGMETLARQSVSLAVQYWDTKRTIRVVGSDQTFDVLELSGSDIKSGTDIRMEAGSSLPTSKAAKQAFIMDMMSKGFIDPQEGLELMDMGGIDKLYETLRIDQRAAQRENIKMRSLDPMAIQMHDSQYMPPPGVANRPPTTVPVDPTGVLPGVNAVAGPANPAFNPNAPVDNVTGQQLLAPPVVTVNTWDNHPVHIQIHNNFRKSQAFDLLDPAVKEQFERHVQAHKSAMQDDIAEAQAMAGPSPGPVGNAEPEVGPMPPATGGSNQFNTMPTGGPQNG